MSSEPYILYIDDERAMIDLVQQTLTLLGYQTVGAVSGKKGMALIRERKPDLLLLDLMMPDFNGWDIFREMKQDKTLADVPIVIITAVNTGAGENVINDLPPAEAYLAKPFDVETLLQVVQKLLKP